MGGEPIYRPGIRGWWAFAYRYSPRGAVKREFVTDFLRRARPSARSRSRYGARREDCAVG